MKINATLMQDQNLLKNLSYNISVPSSNDKTKRYDTRPTEDPTQIP